MKNIIISFILLLFSTTLIPMPVLSTSSAPKDLKAWKDWVLYGKEKELCPTAFNNGSIKYCLWPSRLNLILKDTKGRFSQEWLIIAEDQAFLPGSAKNWPQNVTVDGKAASIIEKNGIPSVLLTQGKHIVEGEFIWNRLPEMMSIPLSTGLINLSLNGKAVDFPHLDKNGKLWLQKTDGPHLQEDQLYLSIYRLIKDTIPMQVVSHLKIIISGRAREERLFRVLPENGIPININSKLPVKLASKGDLILQVRPGRWDIEITTRFTGPVHGLSPKTVTENREIWSFNAQNHLRMVTIEGVSSIDPDKADVPYKWKSFPAYVVLPGSEIIFKEVRRGDPDPAPDQLHINKTWWLDFDGRGLTINDNIHGTINKNWRLSMNPPCILGRASIDGKDQLITSHEKDGKAGVEVRKGTLNLNADSRFTASTRLLPAVGWDHDFVSASAVLNLPPGWKMLTVTGVDNISGTCFNSWTLLDFFLILLISISIWKLKNFWWWFVVSLITMILIFQEANAPHFVWIHVLAATALLRVLPTGKFKKMVFFLADSFNYCAHYYFYSFYDSSNKNRNLSPA
ncbi:membrane hypothetical protein [Candidatus Magnetomoraceae bacterium gMMP-1]